MNTQALMGLRIRDHLMKGRRKMQMTIVCENPQCTHGVHIPATRAKRYARMYFCSADCQQEYLQGLPHCGWCTKVVVGIGTNERHLDDKVFCDVHCDNHYANSKGL